MDYTEIDLNEMLAEEKISKKRELFKKRGKRKKQLKYKIRDKDKKSYKLLDKL